MCAAPCAPIAGQLRVQDHQDLSGGLFEDEDTRVFYEDLPNLQDLVPEVRAPCRRLLPKMLVIVCENPQPAVAFRGAILSI